MQHKRDSFLRFLLSFWVLFFLCFRHSLSHFFFHFSFHWLIHQFITRHFCGERKKAIDSRSWPTLFFVFLVPASSPLTSVHQKFIFNLISYNWSFCFVFFLCFRSSLSVFPWCLVTLFSFHPKVAYYFFSRLHTQWGWILHLFFNSNNDNRFVCRLNVLSEATNSLFPPLVLCSDFFFSSFVVVDDEAVNLQKERKHWKKKRMKRIPFAWSTIFPLLIGCPFLCVCGQFANVSQQMNVINGVIIFPFPGKLFLVASNQ